VPSAVERSDRKLQPLLACRWRRLLIELYAEHKNCLLLEKYCMPRMSKAGFNTGRVLPRARAPAPVASLTARACGVWRAEIAEVIAVADYYEMFQGVLTVCGDRKGYDERRSEVSLRVLGCRSCWPRCRGRSTSSCGVCCRTSSASAATPAIRTCSLRR
jgi:hypothetical protein